jgi:PiT family inorganic phosphate transporter
LVVLAIGFAYSMGAHYTGACMGMPHALRAITAWRALLVMAPLTLLGAAVASHGVEHTVGHNLLTGAGLSVTGLVIVIGVAFGMTSLFNLLRVPTSTIQILVFTVVGVALAAGIGVRWSTITILIVIWVAAPFVAAGMGYALTRLLDLIPVVRVESDATGHLLAHADSSRARSAGRAGRVEATVIGSKKASGTLAAGLIGVGGLASFTMGGNDVANATGSLVGSGTFSPLLAGVIGGLGLAAGVTHMG